MLSPDRTGDRSHSHSDLASCASTVTVKISNAESQKTAQVSSAAVVVDAGQTNEHENDEVVRLKVSAATTDASEACAGKSRHGNAGRFRALDLILPTDQLIRSIIFCRLPSSCVSCLALAHLPDFYSARILSSSFACRLTTEDF